MSDKFNIILLSGGSGSRLWPLSNSVRSKQFIKIFKNHVIKNRAYESMIQRFYRQIKTEIPNAAVTIATSRSQVSSIYNQLGENIDISVEPCRRDTFAAIALSVAYLHDIKGVEEDDVVVVCPIDPYVESSYFESIKKLCEVAQNGEKSLVLMGIKPTYASEKYGYIRPIKNKEGNLGFTFVEKPNADTAEEYIKQGAFWNGGVFAFKLKYVLDKSMKLIGTSDYSTLLANYEKLERISFDYAVVEQETSIEVIPYYGEWKDLGTWNTLTEMMEDRIVGDATINNTCENVHVINELDIPVLAIGLKNIVVAASSGGILVSDKEQSSSIKPFVESLNHQVMFADKSWGTYKVIGIEKDSLIVKVILHAGKRMHYHSHEKRDEVWVVIRGEGRIIVDGMEQLIKVGDVVTMAAGCKHTVIAQTELQMIEVQLGKTICVSDKQKYESWSK